MFQGSKSSSKLCVRSDIAARLGVPALLARRLPSPQWDTAGQDRFAAVTRSFYHKADGIVLVYDVTRRDTFERVRYWLSEIDKHADAGTCRMLIGNKSDRSDRVVTPEEGAAVARDADIPFLETSARTADNVEAAFTRLAEQLVKCREPQPVPTGLPDSHDRASGRACAC